MPGTATKTTMRLDANATARQLGVSRSTLARLVAAGVLPAVRYTPRGHLRFDPEDVQRLVAASKRYA